MAKKDLDALLSDSDSDEETPVVKKSNKKQKKEKDSDEESEKEIKVTSKKTQRKVESDSDSEEEAKPKKVAKKEESSDSEEKKPKKAAKKVVKKEESSDDESSDEEVKPKKSAPKKKSFSEDSEEEKKPKKGKKEKKEESSSDEEEEEVKPKKGKVKEESSDSDESSEEVIKKAKEKQSKKKQESSEDEKDEEPQLVKQEKPKEQKKSYSSGTWNELFIKNLSYNTTDVGLAEYFAKYGDVEETKIVYDKESGRSKGVGFCRFYDAASAVKAMEDAGQMELDGRPISISYSNEKPTRSAKPTNTFKADTNYQGQRFGLFVGNLSFKSNEQGIENFFKDCGKIIDIRIAKTPEGKMKGFAHVDFDSAESVENALKKNGFKLDGRELRLDKSESKPRNGGNKGGFNKARNTPADPITKAKKSGAIIATESKAVALSDSDDE